MALPTIPKKENRSVPMTIRLTKRGAEALRSLAKDHNMSAGQVVEHLVNQEILTQKKNK